MIIRYLNRTLLDDGSTRENAGVTIEPGEPMWPDAVFKPVVVLHVTGGNVDTLLQAYEWEDAHGRLHRASKFP